MGGVAYGIDEKLPASLWGQLVYPFRASATPVQISVATIESARNQAPTRRELR